MKFRTAAHALKAALREFSGIWVQSRATGVCTAKYEFPKRSGADDGVMVFCVPIETGEKIAEYLTALNRPPTPDPEHPGQYSSTSAKTMDSRDFPAPPV